jgi:phthalate 4,5-cis-dihydrodiol dehydrogenase
MLRLGVVGLGLAGGAMAAAAKTHPEIRLAAAADSRDDVRQRFTAAEGLPAYPSLDEMLAMDGGLDAVYIATPHQLHREHAICAARAGAHVIVEKPMALSVEDCDAMIAAARDSGVCLVVGHTHGFSPGVREIARLVRTGRYGRLGMLALWNYTDFLYRPRRQEELDTSRGGGVLYNQVPHQVDIVRTIARSPVRSVRAVAAVLDPARPTEGLCTALLELADGTAASLVYSGYDHFDSDELAGWVAEGGAGKKPGHGGARRALAGVSAAAEREARSTRMSYGARAAVRPAHQPHFGELVVTCAGADFRITAGGVTAYTDSGVAEHPVPSAPWWPGRGDVLQELIDAISGRPAEHDGRFGRETVRVCLAIAESARQHREILLPNREGEPVNAART